MFQWFSNNLYSLWDALIAALVVIGGFLISKKAILAGVYYLLRLGKMAKESIWKFFGWTNVNKYKRKNTVWKSERAFSHTLQVAHRRVEEEYRHWIKSLIAEGSLQGEDLQDDLLYRYFLKYSALSTLPQKKQLAKEMQEELRKEKNQDSNPKDQHN